jgi:hypothetical protein
MWSPGQNFVQGHAVHLYDAANNEVGVFTFTSMVPNGADQAKILIATAEAQTLFGVTADLLMTPVIGAAGGKACFDGPTPPDCVSWGNYAGPTTGVGNPFSAGGLTLGQAATRRLDRGTPGQLDPLDDTNDSATDFVYGPVSPTTNPGVLGAPPGFASSPAAPGPIDVGSMITGFPTPGGSFQVQRTTGGTLTVSNPVLGGTNSSEFSVTTTFPITIGVGGTPQAVQLGCTPQAVGARSATLTLTTTDPAHASVLYDLTCTGLPVPPALDFFTVAPCRVVDTRQGGGGPVAAGADRTFTMVGGTCGVPATAKAVSLNVAVTQPTAAGNLRLFPAGGDVPNASTVNFAAGQTRTNNIVVGLSAAGELVARCAPSGSTHLILDVNGYFE